MVDEREEKSSLSSMASQGEYAFQRLLFAVVCYLSDHVRCVALSA